MSRSLQTSAARSVAVLAEARAWCSQMGGSHYSGESDAVRRCVHMEEGQGGELGCAQVCHTHPPIPPPPPGPCAPCSPSHTYPPPLRALRSLQSLLTQLMGDTQLGAAERSAAVEALLWLQAPEAPPILTPGAVLKCASEGACGGPNRFWPGSGRDQVSSTRFHCSSSRSWVISLLYYQYYYYTYNS